jgi:hypothetical protein
MPALVESIRRIIEDHRATGEDRFPSEALSNTWRLRRQSRELTRGGSRPDSSSALEHNFAGTENDVGFHR